MSFLVVHLLFETGSLPSPTVSGTSYKDGWPGSQNSEQQSKLGPVPSGLGSCKLAPCNLLGSVRLHLPLSNMAFLKSAFFSITRVKQSPCFQTQTIEKFTTPKGAGENLSSSLPLPEITVGNSVKEIFLTFPGVCKYRRLYLLKDGIRLFCDLLPSLGTQS